MMYIKKVFLWAALGLTATATLTSCEDILGHWEKPTPAVPASAVEDARVLGAALEAGATVSVNYTVGGTGYVATFQKNADDTYTLLSNTAAAAGARATTRMIALPDYTVPTDDAATGYVLLELVGDKLVFTVKTAAGAPIFKAEMNVQGGEVTVVNTNGGGQDCTISQVSVGDQAKAIVNPEMQAVNISNDYGSVKYAVKYSEGDTWANVVKRYEGVEVVEITTSDDGFVSVKFSKDFIVATLMATGESTKEQAGNRYNNNFSSTFYLTTTKPNLVAGSRAGTRGSAPTPTFITPTDAVGDAATYYLTPAPVTISLTTPAVGQVIGSDGKNYAADATLPTGVTKVAMIAYVSGTHGLAIALADESGYMDYITAVTTAAAHEPAFTGGIWKLPSLDEWKNMLTYEEPFYKYNNLKTALSTAGGVSLQENMYYWSSTDYDSDNTQARYVKFQTGDEADFSYTSKTSTSQMVVRAVLSF